MGTPDLSLSEYYYRHDCEQRDLHRDNVLVCLRSAAICRERRPESRHQRAAVHYWLGEAARSRRLFATWNARVRHYVPASEIRWTTLHAYECFGLHAGEFAFSLEGLDGCGRRRIMFSAVAYRTREDAARAGREVMTRQNELSH